MTKFIVNKGINTDNLNQPLLNKILNPKDLYEVLNPRLISDFSEIQEDFLRIYSSITNQPFQNKIIILPDTKIHKKTNGRSAAMKRKFIFGKNNIWIREMPIYEIFYELSHEVGHSLKPYLESDDIHAEETKATLFQYIFANAVKNGNSAWRDEFKKFEKWRIDHISIKHPETYAKYHKIAKNIAEQFNYDFELGAKYIAEMLERMKR